MTFDELIKVLKSDVMKKNTCIEVNFSVENNSEFKDCWLGKLLYENEEKYWYGLDEDGSKAYEYFNLDDLINAKVFNDKSIIDIFQHIIWKSLDGCDVKELLQFYI